MAESLCENEDDFDAVSICVWNILVKDECCVTSVSFCLLGFRWLWQWRWNTNRAYCKNTQCEGQLILRYQPRLCGQLKSLHDHNSNVTREYLQMLNYSLIHRPQLLPSVQYLNPRLSPQREADSKTQAKVKLPSSPETHDTKWSWFVGTKMLITVTTLLIKSVMDVLNHTDVAAPKCFVKHCSFIINIVGTSACEVKRKVFSCLLMWLETSSPAA